jgi:hypothetical protein
VHYGGRISRHIFDNLALVPERIKVNPDIAVKELQVYRIHLEWALGVPGAIFNQVQDSLIRDGIDKPAFYRN